MLDIISNRFYNACGWIYEFNIDLFMSMTFINDFISALRNYDQWLYMSWWDIKVKYRRTVLGPFWLVITMFISISCMSVLGAFLFKIDMKQLFPYVACGIVVWAFLSSLIMESCNLFISYAWMLSNLNLNIMSLCIRSFMRNFITFLHGFLIVLLILIFCGVLSVSGMLAAMLGMMVYFTNAVCLCIVLGFLSARYRDGIQIIQSLMNILIFMTPIMWRKEMLGDKQILADVNPFTHFIDIIRAPLLGLELSTLSIIYVLLFTIVNIMSASYLYGKFKNRLVFWL